MPRFWRYVGIDYSGAASPTSSLKGLRAYMADRESAPCEVPPPVGLKRYWTRRGVAEWLVELLAQDPPSLVGIDHGFCFPIQYFQKYALPLDWTSFLDDFHRHWPTNEDTTHVEFVRDGVYGNGAARSGDSKWRRIWEKRARAKSVFHFDVQDSVAKSTHSGIPWLRYVRQRTAGKVHVWPFDGWELPEGRSAIVEVYPALWSKAFPRENRDGDQHDAYSIVAWMQQADASGSLSRFVHPRLSEGERRQAEIEGWVLGVE